MAEQFASELTEFLNGKNLSKFNLIVRDQETFIHLQTNEGDYVEVLLPKITSFKIEKIK